MAYGPSKCVLVYTVEGHLVLELGRALLALHAFLCFLRWIFWQFTPQYLLDEATDRAFLPWRPRPAP